MDHGAFREGSLVLRRILLSCLILSSIGLLADEGMWSFDNLPLERMAARYGFAPGRAWLDHLRLSTVVFGDEGSGCFVGREGLLLTNHHVAHARLQQISDPMHDLVKQGFVAHNRDQEIRMPDLEVLVLVSMKDVTQAVEKAVHSGKEAGAARSAALAEILRKETAESGLYCVSLDFYQGGEYWIYGYRKFTDVRLVMAPEYDIAAFGKDWDNFAYPRHDLDFCLFRVYENGQPYRPEHALACSRKGIPNGGMTLVAGNPGRTDRQETWVQTDFRRRVVNPLIVRTLERNQRTLEAYASASEEHARQVSSELLEAANFLKVYQEEVRELEDPKIAARLQAKDRAFRARIDRDPEWREAGRSWRSLESILRQQETLAPEYQLMHRNYSSLERGPLDRALRLVRLIKGSGAQEDDRSGLLRGYVLNRPLESALLASGLEETREWLGGDHPLTKDLLAGRSPQVVASQAIQGTRIDDQDFVRALIDGGPKALERCQDPLIRLAAKLDPHSVAVKRQYETLEAKVQELNARIARARFALQGRTTYPEASYTLRLSYGAVKTYPAEGTLQQPFTTFGGLFDRADAWGPTAEGGSWALPPRWLQRRKAIDPSIPLNFVTTNDITGGSSGSPMVDRSGELVGLVFDGNIQSIAGRYLYDEEQNRCIAVDVRAILEALAKVYDADHLVKELTAE